jgi:K+-sensing histidine kinase KdpD
LPAKGTVPVKTKTVMMGFIRALLGLAGCALAAAGMAYVFAGHPWRAFVPLGFALVIVLLASRYGMAVALLGSVATALIFAYTLFPPLGSFRVNDAAARGNLAWMLLGSIVISFLLLQPPHGGQNTGPHK